jgi:hypothetical protein
MPRFAARKPDPDATSQFRGHDTVLEPYRASAKIPDQGVSWDYTTWLNIVFLIMAAA